MKNYLKNWNFIRVLRLAVGVFIIVQGSMANEWLLVGLGAMFSLMPIMNWGCCGAATCSTTPQKRNKKTEEITYEEVR